VTSTTTFTVYIFGSASDAEQVLCVAESQHDRGPLDIDDIAAAAWPPSDHRPTAWQEPTLGQQPLSGAFWGLFFGVALLLPLYGTHRPHGLLDAVGLNDGLLDLVTALVVPGTSALFLLSASPPAGRLGDVLTRRSNDTTIVALAVDGVASLRHAFGTDHDGSQV
jgi:uncharacterized membrane protein